MTELDQGLGRVTWWGFSPWSNLAGPSVLLVGAGDPRHLVRSLAASQEASQFFILEQNIQVYCRQVCEREKVEPGNNYVGNGRVRLILSAKGWISPDIYFYPDFCRGK